MKPREPSLNRLVRSYSFGYTLLYLKNSTGKELLQKHRWIPFANKCIWHLLPVSVLLHIYQLRRQEQYHSNHVRTEKYRKNLPICINPENVEPIIYLWMLIYIGFNHNKPLLIYLHCTTLPEAAYEGDGGRPPPPLKFWFFISDTVLQITASSTSSIFALQLTEYKLVS